MDFRRMALDAKQKKRMKAIEKEKALYESSLENETIDDIPDSYKIVERFLLELSDVMDKDAEFKKEFAWFKEGFVLPNSPRAGDVYLCFKKMFYSLSEFRVDTSSAMDDFEALTVIPVSTGTIDRYMPIRNAFDGEEFPDKIAKVYLDNIDEVVISSVFQRTDDSYRYSIIFYNNNDGSALSRGIIERRFSYDEDFHIVTIDNDEIPVMDKLLLLSSQHRIMKVLNEKGIAFRDKDYIPVEMTDKDFKWMGYIDEVYEILERYVDETKQFRNEEAMQLRQ
jgi:hypothetical protein